MATFTVLDAADAETIAAAAGLPTVDAVIPIAAGTINSNFAFVSGDQRWFVRVNEGKQPADVAWEADLVAALAAAGVPTPVPRLVDGARWLVHRGLLVSVFPWIDGAILSAAAVTVDTAAALGATLGRLHRAARPRWPAHGRAGIYQWPDIVARLPRIAAAERPELAAPLATLTATAAELAALAPVRAAASQGLIHGDLFRDNVLWDGGRLVAILDFEQASAGSLVYDLAVVLNDWYWRRGASDAPGPAPALAAAVLAGYQDVRPLTAADRAALPVEVRAAAARFTITRVTDIYLRQLDTPDKDFRAFLARLVAWRGPALGALLSSV